MNCIPTFSINLAKRLDRKIHTQKEFKNHIEFNLNIIQAIECNPGALGLWKTIQYIIEKLVPEDKDYIIICEDDHKFTKRYNIDEQLQSIAEAKKLDADILLGGVSWFTDTIQLSPKLFWVEKFSGLQFTIVFRKFFDTILKTDFNNSDAADYKISELTDNKFLIFPFISTQKEFGYSDATEKNNVEGRVTAIFKSTSNKLFHLDKVSQYYNL